MQLGHEHFSEGIGRNDEHLEAEILKADNAVNREGSQGFISPQQVVDQHEHPLKEDRPQGYSHEDVADFTNGSQSGGCKLVSYSLSLPQFEMGMRGTEFYIDKAVTEMKLPKMIVCYKEGSYHIKNICVDEGLDSFDGILVQNAVKYEKIYDESKFDMYDFTNEFHISDGLKSSRLNGQPTLDVNIENTEHACFRSVPEDCGDTSLTVAETNSSKSHGNNCDEILCPWQESDSHQCQGQGADIYNGSHNQCSLARILEEDRENMDIAENVCASETKELLPIQLDRRHYHDDLSSSESNLDQPQVSDMDRPESVSTDFVQSQPTEGDSHQLRSGSGDCANLPSISGSISQLPSIYDSSSGDQVDEGALEEVSSTTSGVSSKEIKDETQAKVLGTGDSVSNTVAFDMNFELPAIIPNEDIKGTCKNQQPVRVTSSSMLEGTSTDGPTALSQISFNQGHADSNFLGPVSLSGGIAYSGQVPYSGSISLRSDSSTTSTRSFAFPILQSEWNSSPVKMAKTDRRHFRKRQGWRSGLLCCRF